RTTARIAGAAMLLVLCGSAARADDDTSAKRILAQSDVRGGLVVHLHCGDGRLTADLCSGESYLVRGLDVDPANVAKARQHIRSLGRYGKISVDTFDGRRVPLVDNLVNLVVTENLGDVPMTEVMRVLAPGGVACIKEDDTWALTKKPRPEEIDEWTHFLHGPDNNALAEDTVVGPPRRMQWLAGPTWTRHHHADKGTNPSVRAVVSSGGRLYYMVDETASSNMGVASRWMLAARDAFSGVLLWKVPIETTLFERRLEQLWRGIIADGEMVFAKLGTDQPLSALDGATGKVVCSYEGTEDLQEVIKYEDTLLMVTGQNALRAMRADTAALLWQWDPGSKEPIVPLTMAASDDRVFIRTEGGVYCFALGDGRSLWRFVPEGTGKRVRLRWPRERLLVKDGVVICSYGGGDPTVLDRDTYAYLGSHPRVHDYGGKLAALSTEDGSVHWTTDYLPGLESMPGEIYISEGLVWLGPAFDSPRDLRTGKIEKTRPVLEDLWTAGHHYRCFPGKATSKYIITAKRGVEMFDLTGDGHSRNNWVRGTCRVGVTPCNGLIYAPPHSCGCYMEAKLNGFWALAPEGKAESGERKADEEARLERGPAYDSEAVPLSATGSPLSEDWPTYRGDSARSGSTTAAVPATAKKLWKAGLGGRLSAATVADGRVFVAQVDEHTVHALDAKTGDPLWQFIAGGRVDSPPTLAAGLVLFGSRDGWVYCLRASDGQLVWRFRAAPRETGAVAYEQIESLWPVHGSVLVQQGIAYVAAGRSSHLDGGIVLLGLEPRTGRMICRTRLSSHPAEVIPRPPEDQLQEMDHRFSQNQTDYKTFLAPDRSDAFSMRGATTDVLTTEGGSIFMRGLCFDDQLKRQEEKLPHLFSTSSLLDGREHNRSYWVTGTGDFSRTPVAYPWIVAKSLAVPYGVLLVTDDKTAWGVRRGWKGQGSKYSVFAQPRPDTDDPASRLPDFAGRSQRRKNPAGPSWTVELSRRPRAMVRCGEMLFIGTTNRLDSSEPLAESGAEGRIQVVSSTSGQALGNLPLDAPPVWDGMAAAGGRLFVSTRDGAIVCLGDE
ncbi:MAG: PQQ-binding-like beta-propeller repeat protein, partial [Planctomycetes bacterium]|nr:PQQ-binding-like beta-propeller repeat protein [Planctomycetota bacterium]